MLNPDAHKRSAAAAEHVLSAIVRGRPELITAQVFLQLHDEHSSATEVQLEMAGLTTWSFGGYNFAVWQRLVATTAVVTPVAAVTTTAIATVGAAAMGNATAAAMIAALPAAGARLAMTNAARSVVTVSAKSAIAARAGAATASTAARAAGAAIGSAAATAAAHPSTVFAVAGASAVDGAVAPGGAAALAKLFGSGALTAVGGALTAGGALAVTFSAAQYLDAAAYAYRIHAGGLTLDVARLTICSLLHAVASPCGRCCFYGRCCFTVAAACGRCSLRSMLLACHSRLL